jgi:hypothetical protein
MRNSVFGVFCVVAIMLVALPAAGQYIESGIDVWRTPWDGSTRADFYSDPIPADFFCKGSKPFQGTITFGGVPVLTSPEDALAGADTVIRRLDELVFDRGVAETRIQVAALSLASITPLINRCGSFDVRADLSGEQPITTMWVVDEGDGAGTYSAPLSLNIKLSFTPVGATEKTSTLELVQHIDFDPAPNSRWASGIDLGRLSRSHVMVDATGQGRATTLLPGLSGSFVTGIPDQSTATQSKRLEPVYGYYCHEDNGEGASHQHCFWGLCYGSGPFAICEVS